MKQQKVVDSLLDGLDYPLREEVEAVRGIIRGVDERVVEEWKWRAPTFSYGGEYLVTFNLWESKRIHLVFHHPKIAEVESILLEGEYEHRRMTYFTDLDDVHAKRDEFERVLKELIAMSNQKAEAQGDVEQKSDFPKTSAPAQRALQAAGLTRMEELTRVTEKELLKLHGMGPKAIGILRAELEAKGWSFAEEEK